VDHIRFPVDLGIYNLLLNTIQCKDKEIEHGTKRMMTCMRRASPTTTSDASTQKYEGSTKIA
jgi:hypothetical protein